LDTRKVTVKAQETNKAGNPLIRCFVEGITPPNGQYPIALNLTPEQGEALEPGKTEYEAVLVKGNLRKDRDGNDKSGEYPDHFYYEVAMFEGIVNEQLMNSINKGSAAPVSAQPAQAAATSMPHSDSQQLLIMRQTSLKCASWQMVPLVKDSESTELTFQRTCELAERYLGYILTGRTDGMVNAAIEEGAVVADVADEPEMSVDNLFDDKEYSYPEPPERVTSDAFEEYLKKAGWSWEDAEEWLDGLDPIDWVKQEKGRTLRLALRTCRDAAIERGIYPPEDFRTELRIEAAIQGEAK
tara:strand:- start:1083 stop:1976 length:894 start_codon:yes stop_codon:yes gene_type:complete